MVIIRILFAGGGTAGHINPALAIAKQIRKDDTKAQILFVGTKNGMESDLVPREGFEIKYIDVQGLKRKITFRNVVAAWKALKAVFKARALIKEFAPDVVVGTGGYVSGPVVYAAAKLKVPTLIHEQNVFPGFTSKLLQQYADVVAISFLQSKKYFEKAKKVVYTGNPLRKEMFELTKEEARRRLELDDRPFVLAFGGSLGAEGFNRAVAEFMIGAPKDKYQLMLSTGERFYDDVRAIFSEGNLSLEKSNYIRLVPYIHNMNEVMQAADLVIARAGAITLSELTALSKPSVLIPSPNVTDNHQEHNARALEQSGGAAMILERDLTGRTLADTVYEIISDPQKMQQMSEKAGKSGIRNGTEKIVKQLHNLTQGK